MHDISDTQELRPEERTGFIARYFSNIRTIILIVLTLVGAGAIVFMGLPKELNPSIKIPIVTIVTIYPGASPSDVKDLVTVPLEDAVTGLSGLTKSTSSSQEGISVITLEFSSSSDPDKVKQEVQDKVDTVTDIPEDVLDSSVSVVDFQDQPVITFALSGPVDAKTLHLATEEVEDVIKDLPLVEKVSVSANLPLVVTVTVDQNKARSENFNPLTLGETLKRALTNAPGGSVATDENSYAFGVDRSLKSVEDIRALPITIEGRTFLLGDLATVEEKSEVNGKMSWYANKDATHTQAVLFSVYKTDSANAQEAVAAVDESLKTINEKYGSVLVVEKTFDGAKEIQKSFDQLFHDFFLTVGLVFCILIVFFGLRQSVVSSFAIPFTFLITFIIMGIVGISINFIALFSLLLALGILVDNVIVIISAMASYERIGHHTPQESALLVWRDYRSVIFTTTITTIWAFLPLLLASGIIGEFIKPIPIVVSSALAVSALIALFIVIPMMAMLQTGNFARRVIILGYVLVYLALLALLFGMLAAGPYRLPIFVVGALLLALLVWQYTNTSKSEDARMPAFQKMRTRFKTIADEGLIDLHPFALRYEAFIQNVLRSKKKRRRALGALIVFALFAYSLVPLGFVVNEFFPSDDQELVYAALTLPKGTGLAESKEEAKRFIEELRTMPDVRFVLAETGAGAPNDSGLTGSPNSNDLLFTILLTPKEERDISSEQFVKNLNNTYQDLHPNGDFSASQLSGGPPAGSDLQIKLLGDDPKVLDEYARKIEEYLKQQNGVSQVKSSLQTGSGKIVFIPNQQKMAELGVSESTINYWVRALGSGVTLVEDARFGTEKQDVVFRLNPDDLASPEQAQALLIPTNEGKKSLAELGSFELIDNPTKIDREEGKQTISVSAAVSGDFSVSVINKDLEKFASTLDLPQGYSWKTGGVNEENDKSVQSILKAMMLSAVLIFATMTIQFRSFRKSVIVLLVIPMAVSGVFIIFALTGTPLSFPALIGILALFGIVVNNSIIMVDKINKNMDQGLPLIKAVSEGAASRLEPILLTALATIVGLIPITLSDPIWQGLGGAIIAGLLFSGVAKLFMIPVLYFLFYGKESDIHEA